MKKIVNLPNDTIAIICEINDNKNNTYNIIPVEGAIGKIDEKGNFIYEETGKVIPSIEDYDALEDANVKLYYSFSKSIEELANEYQKPVDNLSLIVFNYLKDIASKLNILLKSDGELHIYSQDYQAISPEIVGDANKHYSASQKQEKEIIIPNKNTVNTNTIDVLELEKFLKERIFENDDIIEDIATTVAMNYTATKKQEVESILSIGPTGSGKTATFEAIAEFLNIPLTIYDCSLITSAGYVGESIDDIMRKIYINSKENSAIAEKSILVLDEIDKLAMRGNDVKDAIVQYSFLKLLDGYRYTFELKKNGPLKTLDTSFMTIACLGAFPEMYEAKKKEGSMGFSSDKKFDTNSLEFTTDDIVKFGMLRELIGRIYNIHFYKELSRDDLKRILLESKNSPLLLKIERYEREFNCLVELQDNFLDALVEQAYLKKSGGRGLAKAVSKTFKKIDRELEHQKIKNPNSSVKKLCLTQETVENNRKFNI